MAITVGYAQHKPHSMAFVAGNRRSQQMTITNSFISRRAMFKIQSTCSKRFRVRPALAELPPNASVLVSIVLSPQDESLYLLCVQEREPSACKFLIVVREVESAVAIASAAVVNNSSGGHGKDPEQEVKRRWEHAERWQHESLLYSETVDVEIVEQQCSPAVENEAALVAPPAPSLIQDTRLSSSTLPLVAKCCPQLSPLAGAFSAEIVVLMMKNQSPRPENILTNDEKLSLVRLHASCTAEQWSVWQVYAYRMRVLLREQSRRASKQ